MVLHQGYTVPGHESSLAGARGARDSAGAMAGMNFVLCVQLKMRQGFPRVEECAIRKRRVWRSPYLTLGFFSCLCVRLDS